MVPGNPVEGRGCRGFYVIAFYIVALLYYIMFLLTVLYQAGGIAVRRYLAGMRIESVSDPNFTDLEPKL